VRGLDLVQADRSITTLAVVRLAVLAIGLAACAPFPAEPPGPTGPRPPRDETTPRYPYEQPPQRNYGDVDLDSFPRSADEVSGPAVMKLLQQARAELQAGRTEQAVAALETALDIEPRNPFIWQQLAETHLAQYLPDQAENKAQRSSSFARGNPFVEVQNWRVIAAARQARGDLSGARAARERMEELQALIDD
jgi:hypothetical protein